MSGIILLTASLVNIASHASPVMFSPDCGQYWWLDDNGQPKQNLHCGQLFPDPSSTSPPTTMSSATSSSPSSTSDLSQPCSNYEFLCGDGYTCLSLSKLCDGVSISFEWKWEHDSTSRYMCDGKLEHFSLYKSHQHKRPSPGEGLPFVRNKRRRRWRRSVWSICCWSRW